MNNTAEPQARTRTVTSRIQGMVTAAGFLYVGMYVTRWSLRQLVELLERGLVATEQKRRIVEPWAVSGQRFTVAQNQGLWHSYDWSSRGEEWTKSAEWKAGLVREFLVPAVPEGGTVLEIGPGGGRWTDYLQKRARKVIVADVAEQALSICRERFADCSNIEYLHTTGQHLAVADESVDAVWSYDVFVHINPLDARAYFQEFRRILRPGGRAVIHHPGQRKSWGQLRRGWRSDLTNDMIQMFVRLNGLVLVRQTTDFVNQGDVLSVIEKPLSEALANHSR